MEYKIARLHKTVRFDDIEEYRDFNRRMNKAYFGSFSWDSIVAHQDGKIIIKYSSNSLSFFEMISKILSAQKNNTKETKIFNAVKLYINELSENTKQRRA